MSEFTAFTFLIFYVNCKEKRKGLATNILYENKRDKIL